MKISCTLTSKFESMTIENFQQLNHGRETQIYIEFVRSHIVSLDVSGDNNEG